jgi:hypothetical protein
VAEQEDEDGVARLHARSEIGESLFYARARRLLVREIGDVGVRHGVLLLRRLDERRRPRLEFLRVLFIAGHR